MEGAELALIIGWGDFGDGSLAVLGRDPAWAADAPYVVAVIETDEGVRVVGGPHGVAPSALRLGLPVVWEWAERGEVTVPVWRAAV